MTVRDRSPQPQAARTPAIAPRHVCGGPGLVDKDQALGIERRLAADEDAPSLGYIRAVPGLRRGRLYAPEHNPDEFLNNDLKPAMARRRTPRDKAALKSGLTSYMRSPQRCPAKVRAFFQAPTVRYAA